MYSKLCYYQNHHQNSLNAYILVLADEYRLVFDQIICSSVLEEGLVYKLFKVNSNITVKTSCYKENTSVNARYILIYTLDAKAEIKILILNFKKNLTMS